MSQQGTRGNGNGKGPSRNVLPPPQDVKFDDLPGDEQKVYCFSCFIKYIEIRACVPESEQSKVPVPSPQPLCSKLVREFVAADDKGNIHSHLVPKFPRGSLEERCAMFICTANKIPQRVQGTTVKSKRTGPKDYPIGRASHGRQYTTKQYVICGACKNHLGTYYKNKNRVTLSNRKIIVASNPAEPATNIRIMDITRIVTFGIKIDSTHIKKISNDTWPLYESEFYVHGVDKLTPFDPEEAPLLPSLDLLHPGARATAQSAHS